MFPESQHTEAVFQRRPRLYLMLAARRGNMQKPCTVGSDSIDAAGLKMSWRTFEAWLYVAGLELLKSNQDRSW